MSIEMLGAIMGTVVAIIGILLTVQWIDTFRFNKNYTGSIEEFHDKSKLINMHKMNLQGDFKINKGMY